MIPNRLWIVLIAAVLAAGAGCRRPTVQKLDEQERRDPAIQAAWAAAETGDVSGAEAQYDAVLRRSPDNARAHLDLAMVLMTTDEKPVKSIYHFMRYLELRPDAKNRALINHNVWALTTMLGTVAAKSRISGLEQQVAQLQAENETLRHGAPLAPPSAGAPAPNPAAAPGAATPAASATTAAAPAGSRTYTVQAGDSLTRIAQKMYGDMSKGSRIYEANKGKLKSVNALQVGQVLVIPPL